MAHNKQSTINCLQINLQRSRAATSNLNRFISQNKVDLVFVQEPYTVNNKIAGFPKSVSIHSQGEGRKRAAVLVLNKDLDVMIISQCSSEDNILIEIITTTKFKFYAASMYFDRQKDVLHDTVKMEEFKKIAGNKPIIFSVDSNARSKTWYDNIQEERGLLLEEWLSSNSLFTLNNNSIDDISTFETSRAQSNIDLTIVNYQMLGHIDGWKVSDEESASDHKYIRFQILSNRNQFHQNGQSSSCKYITAKTDWDSFHAALVKNMKLCCKANHDCDMSDEQIDDKMVNLITGSDDLNRSVEQFLAAIKNTCEETVPKIKKKKSRNNGKSVHWWNPELTRLRREANSKRRIYQRTKRNAILRQTRKTEYYVIKNEYKDKMNLARLNSWKEFCNATDKNQPWNYIYKAAAGKLKSNSVFCSLRKPNGEFTATLDETLNVLLDKYVPLDDPASDTENNAIVRLESMNNEHHLIQDDIPFTGEELKAVIQSFDPKKTPGEDGFNQRIIAETYAKLPKFILSLYNECLKQGKFPNIWKISTILSIVKPGKEHLNDAEKYRPISLLSVWGKILEKLLINRIMFHLRENNFLSDRQYGFTPQKGTLDAILDIKQYVKGALDGKKVVLMIALDVKGAFDAAWWPAILVQLKKFDCPRNLFLLAQNYFKDRLATIKTNTLTLQRQVTRGCPQGSCCGPGFWIIQYDSLLRENFPQETKVVAFADDLLIAVSGNNELEAECSANACMRIVEKWSENNKMTFNSHKSKVLVVSKKRATSSVSVFLNNKCLMVTQELKYLGVLFDPRLSWNNHIKMVCERSLQLTNQLSRSAKVYWGIGSEALRIIYNGALVPLLTYAIPIWCEGLDIKRNMNKLRRVQRLFLLRVIKGFRTISYEAACTIANIPPIQIVALQMYKRFRIVRGIDDETTLNIEHPTPLNQWMHPGTVPEITLENDIDNSTSFRLQVYTDGSKSNEKVGCAFVVYLDDLALVEQRIRLGEHCSNNQAELLAIMEALHWLVKAFSLTTSIDISALDKVVVRTDSQVALDSITGRKNHMLLIKGIRRDVLNL